MKLSLILVFVLMFLTSDAKKSKKKKTSASNNLRRLKQLLKGLTIPTQSTVPKTSSTVKPKTNPPDSFKNPFHILSQLTTAEEFYKKFNYSRLPQHKKGRGQSGADNVGEVQTSALCSLRPTVVPLPLPRYGEGIIFPSCALLHRCIGCCIDYNILTCRPVVKETKKVFYYHLTEDVLTNEVEYEIKAVEMEEHVLCGCSCKQTASSCDPLRQIWKEDECRCGCQEGFKKENYPCSIGFMYDSSTCSCVCAKPVRDCRNANKEWSHTDCDCVCRKKSCASRTQSLDPHTCECVQLRG